MEELKGGSSSAGAGESGSGASGGFRGGFRGGFGKRKLDVQVVKKESLEWGKANVLEVSHTIINGKEMISLAKFFKSPDGERKYPKGFAIPLDLKDSFIEAVKSVTE
jgi:hypothetical protein